MKTKRTFAAWLSIAALALFAFTATSISRANQNSDHWVGTWAKSAQSFDPTKAPPNTAPPPVFTDATLR